MIDELKIKKGSPKFLRAIDSIEGIHSWWEHNPDCAGVAMVGRSNVGKSSLINSLFGAKTARTSKTPGRTQKINIFSFVLENDPEEREYFLYDLPGYGHAEVNKAMSRNWREIMTEFFITLNSNSLLFCIQDARHPNQKTDQVFFEYINPAMVPIILLFNKMDKLKKQKERAALNKLKPEIFKNYKNVKSIHFVSAEKRQGLDTLETELVDYLLS